MIFVFPVYDNSICISKSTHDALLGPGPTYSPCANHKSTEIHTVCFVPGPWVSKTSIVLADDRRFVLDGHNTGMMIPHLSPMMDNLMLLPTLLGSSCSWPFVSASRSVGKKCVVGFLPLLAPYIFCDSPKEGKSNSDAEAAELKKDGKMRMLVVGEVPAPRLPVASAMSGAASDAAKKVGSMKSKLGSAAGGTKLGKLAGKAAGTKLGGFAKSIVKVNGKGIIYIPMGKTVMMRMSLADLLAGWARIFVANAASAIGGLMVKDWKFKDNGIMDRDAMARVGRKKLAEYMAVSTVNKVCWDGLIKSMAMDAKIKAPYGIFSYSPATGKGSYGWWGTFETGGEWPFDFKGLNALPKEFLETKPIETLAQTPNIAAG